MRREPARTALVVGLVAAAATTGALLGIGVRLGTPGRAFNAVSRLAFGARAEEVWGFDPMLTTAGVLLHAGMVLVIGIVFALLARGVRGARMLLVALGYAAFLYALDVSLRAPFLALRETPLVPPPQRAVLYLVLALALAFGMRIARRSSHSD